MEIFLKLQELEVDREQYEVNKKNNLEMSLSLKINIVGSNTVKTMRFSPEMSVHEACLQIKDKVGEGGEDHGLFQAGVEGKIVSRWLAMDKSLSFYDLSLESVLDYKKKHRPQKIKLLDETIKTQLIDDSTTVTEIVASIAKKMGIKNPEEYSLLKEAPVLDEKELKKQQKEGKEADVPVEWLKSTQTLSEQGVVETDILVFKKKFFFNDANIDRNDPVQLHLLFVQCRDAIIEGKYPTQREESVQLAAIQCQVALGDHAPQKHIPGFLNLKEYLPLQWVKNKSAEKDIYKEHRKLVSMTEVNAKYRYVQLCRSLKTYGMTSFQCKFRIGKKMLDMTLGITRENMILIQDDTKEVIKNHPLKHIRRWASTEKSFTFDFGDHEQERSQVIMAELSTVGSCAKNAAFVPELASFSDEIIAIATRLSESMSKLLTTASTMGDSVLADDAIARAQVHATNALAVMMMAAVDNIGPTSQHGQRKRCRRDSQLVERCFDRGVYGSLQRPHQLDYGVEKQSWQHARVDSRVV
ncbi:hypothetical protein DFA_12115 [Cavenderia fasciculata]|uniref:FERM domain-containing protein n=1 Tax=Cavenderia fasciculata TaxID=261658 RepID=F4QFU8_CACFS|nr:uncharacterized protein DFA_12115 [Cavenderia fasciculata]EGG14345.1 hypothetical protein DFA_12115 [Cavenderia fasciculata]|eukprot:XP_004351054.1 hypothetical protein DFA_12115 [Cavenderia fasciculata]